MSLIAHKDTMRCSEADVLAVPEPKFTETWRPIGHRRIVHALEDATQEIGLEVRKREYSLNTSGTRCFGVWDLSEGSDKACWSLGFRNAIDKSMALGMCGGRRVFVCDNLALSGEFLTFHKHTAGLTQVRLIELTMKAVEGVIPHMEQLEYRHESFKRMFVWDKDLSWIIVQCLEEGVFSPSAYRRFLAALDEELALNAGSRTLAQVHGAVTRMGRERNLFQVAGATSRFEKVADKYIEMRLEEGKYVPELLN